ncbi:UDP-glucose 4-epimerase (EC [Olavius algarvensis associated proteobacterium Delta 3]|nr:UDP-glucose 4-epimerase (EC [Olavius algarvensis associated proteobacterium Delta 3]
MKKILVTGATGFIGIEVSKQLAARGWNPRLMVRRPLRGIMLKNLPAEVMQADLRSPGSIERILEGVEAIIHLGARAAFEPYPRLYPSIVQGSLNLLRAAIRSGVSSFIFGGSLMVYRDTPDGIDQDTPVAPASGYGQAKLEAERRLESEAKKAGVRFVSLRLPHVYGAHSLLFDQVRHGRIYFPGKADNPFAHIHIADTARALIHAAESDLEGIRVIADNQSCTWNEFFETVRTYYPRLRVTHVPEKISYAGARILDVLYPLVGQSNPYPSGAVSCWNLSLPVKPGSFRQVCGFDLQFPSIHDGIPAVLDDSISFYWLPSNLDLM